MCFSIFSGTFALKENQQKKYELPGCTQALLLQEGLSPAPAPGTPCLFLSPSALLKDASWGCGPYSVCYTDGGSLPGGPGAWTPYCSIPRWGTPPPPSRRRRRLPGWGEGISGEDELRMNWVRGGTGRFPKDERIRPVPFCQNDIP